MNIRWKTSLTVAALGASLLAAPAWAQKESPASTPYEPTVGQAGKDVVWVPTSQALVDRMLDMAKLTPADRLVDLGSGDGRTVITAAKRGAVSRGIEFNPDLVALSKRNAAAEGVSQRATFEQADIFKSNFSNATVVTLFLLPELNARLRPILLDMKPGTRVVSNSFRMESWEPDQTEHVTDGCSSFCDAYLWIVPAKVAGNWRTNDGQLQLTQTNQMLEGALRKGTGSTPQPISDAKMNGVNIQFTVGTDQYKGVVSGKQIKGTVNGNKAWTAQRQG